MILWLDDAVNDLQALRQYISHDKPTAANRVGQQILHTVSLLAQQSGIGRPGRVHGTRELIIPNTPYIIPYRIKNNTVEILRVLHSSMQWPDELKAK